MLYFCQDTQGTSLTQESLILWGNSNPEETSPLETARSFAFAGRAVNADGIDEIIVAGGKGVGNTIFQIHKAKNLH